VLAGDGWGGAGETGQGGHVVLTVAEQPQQLEAGGVTEHGEPGCGHGGLLVGRHRRELHRVGAGLYVTHLPTLILTIVRL